MIRLYYFQTFWRWLSLKKRRKFKFRIYKGLFKIYMETIAQILGYVHYQKFLIFCYNCLINRHLTYFNFFSKMQFKSMKNLIQLTTSFKMISRTLYENATTENDQFQLSTLLSASEGFHISFCVTESIWNMLAAKWRNHITLRLVTPTLSTNVLNWFKIQVVTFRIFTDFLIPNDSFICGLMFNKEEYIHKWFPIPGYLWKRDQ